MRIYRYRHQGKIRRGVLEEEKLYPIRGSIYRKFEVGRSGVPISRVLLLRADGRLHFRLARVAHRDDMARPTGTTGQHGAQVDLTRLRLPTG